jgi:putative ABC transport system permease protein
MGRRRRVLLRFRIGKHWLLWLALRELWHWRWRSLLSLLALALSTGLVVATGSIGRLMQAGVMTPVPPVGRHGERTTELTEILWISSAYDVDYDLPASLRAQVAVVDGVSQVYPVLRRPVHVQTPRPDALTLLGVEPGPYFALHGLTLSTGSFPPEESPGLVALAPWAFIRDLALGDSVTVTTPTGNVALPITGLVEVRDLVDAQQGLVLYMPLDTMAALFDLQDTATTLELRLVQDASPRQVRDDLEQALGPAYTVSTASKPGQTVQLWQRLVMGALILVDGLIWVGSVGLVYAIFALAARTRCRQIGLLRTVGAVRWQVLALLVTQATILGIVGSGMGMIVGLVFTRIGANLVMGESTPQPPGVDGLAVLLPMPAGSSVLAIGLGLLASLTGAIGPALRAARLSPLAALHTVPTPRPTPRTQRGRLQKLLSHPACPFEVRLAVTNLGRERGRALLIAGTLGLILGMALGNVGVLSLLSEELTTTIGRLAGGDYLVLPGLTTISLRELAGQDTSDMPPLGPELLAALEHLEDQVWLMSGTTANIEPLQVFPGQPTLLLDIEGYAQMGGFRFHEGNWSDALGAFRQGPAVLLTPVVARRLNVGMGDQVQLDTLNGPVNFRVAGIGDSEFTTCVLSLADGMTHFGANEVNGVEVQIRPDGDPQTVRRALLDVVQEHGGTLLSLNQALGQLRQMFRQARVSIDLLIGITGLVALLGVINTTLTSVTERRREFSLLRAVGATRLQLNGLILTEMAILGTAAALIGIILGWVTTLCFSFAARTYLGLTGESLVSPVTWRPLIAASAAGLVLWPFLAVLSGLVPSLRAARLSVIETLHEGIPG